jgi:threonine/homoserine/homoserine lactone efflux protein
MRFSISCALGIATGSLIHALSGVMGIGLLVTNTKMAYVLLQIFGSIYLFILGINLLRTSAPITSNNAITYNKTTLLKAYLTGFLTNILNPKTLLFYIALFTNLFCIASIQLKVVVVIQIFVSSILWYTGLAFSFSHNRIQPLFAKHAKTIRVVFGIILILLSVSPILK